MGSRKAGQHSFRTSLRTTTMSARSKRVSAFLDIAAGDEDDDERNDDNNDDDDDEEEGGDEEDNDEEEWEGLGLENEGEQITVILRTRSTERKNCSL